MLFVLSLRFLGEHVFLEGSAPVLVSNQIVSARATKSCKFGFVGFLIFFLNFDLTAYNVTVLLFILDAWLKRLLCFRVHILPFGLSMD